MSLPHTGKLEAEIHGKLCQFDGDVWTSPDAALAESLNLWTEFVPKTHYPIQSIAEVVFRRAGLTDFARIISAVNDTWKTELPAGAID